MKKCTLLKNRLRINTLSFHRVKPHSDPDPRIRTSKLTDLDATPDTAPDPAIFFSDLQDGN
jgi:hypothetical protein